MTGSRELKILHATAVTAGLVAALAVSAPAPAATASPATWVTAPARAASALPGVTAQKGKAREAPPNAVITFAFALRRPEGRAIAALKAVSDPKSAQYRRFPGRATIRSRYGATPLAQRIMRRFAARYGLTTRLDPTGVFVSVTGKVRDFERGFGAPVVMEPLPLQHAGTAVGYGQQLGQLPRELRGVVTDSFPSYTKYHYARLQLSGATAIGYQVQPAKPNYNGGTPQGCVSQDDPALSQTIYSLNELRAAYGVDGLPGTPAHMVVLSQGSGFSDEALRASKDCFSLPGVAAQRVPIGGLSSRLPEAAEGDLDTQLAQAVLPAGSRLTVIESGEADPLFLGYSAMFGLPAQATASSLSAGLCEPDLPAGQRRVTESVLVRNALAGTSSFASAGDAGSSGCWDFDQQSGPEKIAVNYPASSAYVTAVGGTRISLDSGNARTDEVVWNSTERNPPIHQGKVAGGGGTSVLFRRPWWQDATIRGGKPGRAVPDLAAHASQLPGWPLAYGGGFAALAGNGTSAASPFTASAFAVMAATEQAQGRPLLGLVTPWLYTLRQQQPEAFFDVVSGSNDLFDVGCCVARPGYDEASGLGAPNFTTIAGNVPPPGGS